MGGNILEKPKLWRQRFIPCEMIDISRDEVLYRDDKFMVTRWEPINPRKDFQKGISYYFLDKGIKVNKLFNGYGEFIKYYCDIFEYEYHHEEDEYIFRDLLVDVTVTPDEKVKILDIDELADALETSLITKAQAVDALKKLNELLLMVYLNKFPPEELSKYDYDAVN